MMMEYFYASTYKIVEDGPSFGLSVHARVHALAIKYQVSALETMAKDRYFMSLNRVSDYYVIFTSVFEVYKLTPPECRALRDFIVEATVNEIRNILEDPRSNERLRQVMAMQEQFFLDVLYALTLNGPIYEMVPVCQACGPGGEDYEIEIECRSCGKTCAYVLN